MPTIREKLEALGFAVGPSDRVEESIGKALTELESQRKRIALTLTPTVFDTISNSMAFVEAMLQNDTIGAYRILVRVEQQRVPESEADFEANVKRFRREMDDAFRAFHPEKAKKADEQREAVREAAREMARSHAKQLMEDLFGKQPDPEKCFHCEHYNKSKPGSGVACCDCGAVKEILH